jgi:hypothetical protein
MNGFRALKILSRSLSAVACGCVITLNLAAAGIQESRFDFSADGVNVEFEVRDVPRREVLSRLFADTGIEIRWINSAFADETMSGTFRGAPDIVSRQLLAHMNFVVVNEGSSDAPRITRLIVVGPAKGEKSWPSLSAITNAMALAIPTRAARKEAPPAARTPADPAQARAIGTAEMRPVMPVLPAETGQATDAQGVMKPPPPDEAAPLPVLTAGMDAPLLVVPPDTTVPFMPAVAGVAPPLVPVASDRVNP